VTYKLMGIGGAADASAYLLAVPISSARADFKSAVSNLR
jgi:hypothetical protein